jgi:hypothetical protein
MTTQQWFKTFFEEKNLPFAQWEIETSDGDVHLISNEVVIEAIHQAPLSEQKQIQGVIRRLDFANADVNDFLKHLARGLIETRIAA